jgi:hypothetical protein
LRLSVATPFFVVFLKCLNFERVFVRRFLVLEKLAELQSGEGALKVRGG